MKKFVLPISFLLVFLLPGLLFSLFDRTGNASEEVDDTVSPELVSDHIIKVKDASIVKEMELESYVLGVLLGEMPAEFELEALKAQAVATRTYTLRRGQKQSKHPDASVCTDATCCQAYINLSDYTGGDDHLKKLQLAVSQTAGEVITYQGNLIEATYFSCSGGQTEDAVAVWGTSVPYLRSVVSPGEEEAKYYETEYTFTQNEFRSMLGLSKSVDISNGTIQCYYTAGGGVDKMVIAEQSWRGTQVRSLLGLPSTAFTLAVGDDNVTITVKGNGHRVGMSQYGAEAMAVTGKKYNEILTHYYPGTKIELFDESR